MALAALALGACSSGHRNRPGGVAAWCSTYQPKDGSPFLDCAATEAECRRWDARPDKTGPIGAPCQRSERVWCFGGHQTWPLFCEPTASACGDDLDEVRAKVDPKLDIPCAPFPD